MPSRTPRALADVRPYFDARAIRCKSPIRRKWRYSLTVRAMDRSNPQISVGSTSITWLFRECLSQTFADVLSKYLTDALKFCAHRHSVFKRVGYRRFLNQCGNWVEIVADNGHAKTRSFKWDTTATSCWINYNNARTYAILGKPFTISFVWKPLKRPGVSVGASTESFAVTICNSDSLFRCDRVTVYADSMHEFVSVGIRRKHRS